ncbi:hypothetical protein Poli38472_004335 [Pythium oligandrum]|uniref:1,3-beta-glucanosyltransferase n=1 Tax=Pythium oligandrum TaxID=41045 RepID=A0A8K1FEC2_PYTOL|nr:hypothetical protein Poli38472_004335 [Pythium oligandrum]|eukprot:TMW59266.1 hypothetical protein Poli38472_004335 [Pythium oligandrum]
MTSLTWPFASFNMVSTRFLVYLTALAASSVVVDAWLPPLVAKGNKFFDSDSGEEFRIKGMAYYPRPNSGELAGVTGYDWTTDDHEDVWGPHLEVMKDLGVNTVRLYSVDPNRPHDKFMCAASEAGIYVIVGMVAPCENCAVPDLAPPSCYPSELFTRVQMIYNAFAVYDNVLGFSVGNENNMPTAKDDTGTLSAPCVKALLRDTKAYASSCAGDIRQVPIGLDLADITPREQWIQYYDCVAEEDINTSADWLGFNPYVECDPVKHTSYEQSTGLQKLMSDYKAVNYSQPIMFGEFGCNKGANTVDGYENQRSFLDAKWMNEEAEMTAEIVGGNVFEFSTEIANLANEKKISKKADPGNYGVGYFDPATCDNDKTVCEFTPYPEYENLKKAYTTTKASTNKLDDFKPTRNVVLTCPKGMSVDLPKAPDVEKLACYTAQPVCSGKKSNNGDKSIKGRRKDTRLTPGITLKDSGSDGGDSPGTVHADSGKDGEGDDAKPGSASSKTPAPSAASRMAALPALVSVASAVVALVVVA